MPNRPGLHRWDSSGTRVAVHVLHGMVEHGIRYERLAVTLNCRNFSVWAHDHRGHGWNPHPEVGLGHFADAGGWRLLIDDAWEVSQLMMQTYPGVPLVLFAHSMGSFIAQALMAEHGDAYAGVVLAGTNGPPVSEPPPVRRRSRATVTAPAVGSRPTSTPNAVVVQAQSPGQTSTPKIGRSQESTAPTSVTSASTGRPRSSPCRLLGPTMALASLDRGVHRYVTAQRVRLGRVNHPPNVG